MSADELADLLSSALKRAGESDADVMAVDQDRGYARFADGTLSQHMALSEPRVNVRVARGKRVAEVSVGKCDEDAVVESIAKAASLAAMMPEDEHFPGFSSGDELCPRPRPAPAAEMSAEARAAMLEQPVARIIKSGLSATGALETRTASHAVVNTRGLRRCHDSTYANYRIWALETAGGRGASGFAQSVGPTLDCLDLETTTDCAIDDAQRSKSPISLEPTTYDVVLAPDAVAELFEWMAFIAFGAESLQQGTSPLAEKLGEAISGTSLSVEEDPHGSLSYATPFDREGTPRQHVDLINAGVARGVVTDRRWAARLGGASTGHAPWPSLLDSGAPQPSAMVLGEGTESDLKQLLRAREARPVPSAPTLRERAVGDAPGGNDWAVARRNVLGGKRRDHGSRAPATLHGQRIGGLRARSAVVPSARGNSPTLVGRWNRRVPGGAAAQAEFHRHHCRGLTPRQARPHARSVERAQSVPKSALKR